MFLPSARWDELQCIVKVVHTYNANAGARELHPAHNHCTRSTDDEEVRSQKPWRLLFPHKPVHKKKVRSGLKCKSSVEHPKPIQIPSLSHHYHLCNSQSESSRLKVILRILPLAIALKLSQHAVNLPQPYARFWLWRILRPQPLCAMLPWSSWSSS